MGDKRRVRLDAFYPEGVPRPSETDVERVQWLLDNHLSKGVTPASAGGKTWTYEPRSSMSMSFPASQAWRAVGSMLRQLLRHPRTPVTVEMWSEPGPPYTVERDENA